MVRQSETVAGVNTRCRYRTLLLLLLLLLRHDSTFNALVDGGTVAFRRRAIVGGSRHRITEG